MSKGDISMIGLCNPLDKRSLGVSIVAAMLTLPVHTLPPEPFIGTGIYAIYYRGDSALYKRSIDLNKERYNVLIYAGKAASASVGKGGLGMNVDHRLALSNRLSEHFGPVSRADSLNEKDLMYRYLVMDDIWIPLTEFMLAERFRPSWNRCIDGLGSHDPGKGRYQQQKSPQDCIHEGQGWTEKFNSDTTSKDELLERVARYLENYTVQFREGQNHLWDGNP